MKKPIFIFALLCSSLLSFSQKEIENWSHPFQVLFVDSASYIGKQEPVKQFDFLSKYDLIRNSGELVLLHYSGVVLEITEKILNVREFSKDRETHEYIERPIISDPEKFNNKSINRRINATGVGHYCVASSGITVTYPLFEWSETQDLFAGENFIMCWKTDENKASEFIVSYKNIFDELILCDTVQTTSISTSVDKLFDEEGLFIVRIIDLKDPDNSSTDLGFRVNTETRNQINTAKYSLLIDALSLPFLEEPEASQQLFLMSITSSNQDPRFIKLYEDFLERNPTFKENAE